MTDSRLTAILIKLLPLVAEQGWTMQALNSAAQQAGITPQQTRLLLPQGISSALSAWQSLLDEQMIQRVQVQGWGSERVRDKIAQGVWTRLELIGEHDAAFRQATRQRLWHPVSVTGDLWRSADAIWTLAGDTSTDYNHYTKRLLLGQLLFRVTLSYLGDVSPDYRDTRAYLDSQIERIVMRGQKLHTFKPTLSRLWTYAEKMGVQIKRS